MFSKLVYTHVLNWYCNGGYAIDETKELIYSHRILGKFLEKEKSRWVELVVNQTVLYYLQITHT